MKKPLVSIIIPVYNLEEYLPKCIESVLCQTYDNFEIIAVDDGSTDNSAQILKEYTLKDSRIKPIFKANGGVSSTRNVGIEKSQGEYIYFLDGDDWIEPDTIEKMLDRNGEFDIVQGAHVNSYANGTQDSPIDFECKILIDKNEILGNYFINKIQESCCNKLYKKSMIGDIRFDENLAVAEDSKFVYSILKKTSKIKLISDVTYHYFCRDNSCTNEKLKEKHFEPLQFRDAQFLEIKDDKNLYNKFLYAYSKLLFFLIRQILFDKSGEFKDRISMLRGRVMKHRKGILLSEYIGLRFKIGVLILWLCPKLFYKIYGK